MFENLDLSLINWSRAQFALTAIYHWLFVPLTLGLSFIIAFMETRYFITGDERWKNITKFWMRLFGVNFAIGVATGLILEFEFGTNWSNYSWFVGDIFGAPLAIEGIMAFFMESTFIAVMYFGWNKVSKGFHLTATWLTAIGSNLSAVWILVANAWMQHPRGMQFNPDTARNEMLNFSEVIFSPSAINKFFHTVTSSYLLAAIFVIGVSAWYLLHNRKQYLAKESIRIATFFGIIATAITIYTGDSSARTVAKVQPMKFAAMEAHVHGRTEAPLHVWGFVGDIEKALKDKNESAVSYGIKIPSMLSFLIDHTTDAYVPGIYDLLYGNKDQGILSASEKIKRGYIAQKALLAYKEAKAQGLPIQDSLRHLFSNEQWSKDHFAYFGYGSYYNEDPAVLEKNRLKIIPPVGITFYAFHIMVGLGFWFLLVFIVMYILLRKNQLTRYRWWLWLVVFSIPLVYIASESGWIVTEVGRQPWIIQDLMTNAQAVTRLDSESVILTFSLFAITFTILLIAEIGIMLKQIKKHDDTTESL
jgi:cytochrome d ubiquinol oxidase subunit I